MTIKVGKDNHKIMWGKKGWEGKKKKLLENMSNIKYKKLTE